MENLTLGEKLSLLRKRKKLTQSELSKITGIHLANISKYELDNSMPSLLIFKKLVQALDTSADYLLFT
jgi:transcriptional regulator with XRE-family HTH domain